MEAICMFLFHALQNFGQLSQQWLYLRLVVVSLPIEKKTEKSEEQPCNHDLRVLSTPSHDCKAASPPVHIVRCAHAERSRIAHADKDLHAYMNSRARMYYCCIESATVPLRYKKIKARKKERKEERKKERKKERQKEGKKERKKERTN